MKERTDTNEEWKVIEGYPRYQVSNKGRIMSYTNPKRPKLLRTTKTREGFLIIKLVRGNAWGNGETNCERVHQLVAKHFIPNPYNRCHITFTNGDRSDCKASNLKWVEKEEYYKKDLAVIRNRQTAIPQRIEKTSKPVLVYDENLTLLSAFTSTAETARRLNLSQGNITNVCNGTLNHYKHMIFSYIPLNSKEDRDKVEQEAEEKRKRRLQQVNKACQKIYYSDIEKGRAKGRAHYYKDIEKSRAKGRAQYYKKKYGKEKSEQNSRGNEEA